MGHEQKIYTPSGIIHTIPYYAHHSEGQSHFIQDGSEYRCYSGTWVLVCAGRDYTYATNMIDGDHVVNDISKNLKDTQAIVNYQDIQIVTQETKIKNLVSVIEFLANRVFYLEKTMDIDNHDVGYKLTGKPSTRSMLEKLKIKKMLEDLL